MEAGSPAMPTTGPSRKGEARILGPPEPSRQKLLSNFNYILVCKLVLDGALFAYRYEFRLSPFAPTTMV